jgi:protein-disulfide isomerase
MQPKSSPVKPVKLAQKAPAPDPKEEFRENAIAVGIVLLIVAGGLWWIFVRMTAPAPEESAVVQMPIGASPVMGSDTAPMTVVVFSDFECPFCAEFALEEMPEIKERFIDTGQVRLAFKHFPLESHARAAEAAQAAACVQEIGGDDAFWEYHDTLFENPKALSDEDLLRYATDMGIEGAEFSECMQREPVQVNAEWFLGKEAGVVGTPTFFFNGRKVIGFLSAEEFAAQLE